MQNEAVAAETCQYQAIPEIVNFIDEGGVDRMKEQIRNELQQS